MFGLKSKKEKEEERKKLKEELLDEIRAEQERKEKEIEEAKREAEEEARRIHEAAEKARIEEEEKLKNSDTPWITVRGEGETDEQGKPVKIELDWNDAFIKYLRANGYQGADDETIVQHYLAVLAKMTADDMAEKQNLLSDYE